MKYVDEFRDPKLIRQAADEVRRLARPDRNYRIMEVCGGHTHAIYRFGLEGLLPDNVELIHGPGCPVCVLPMGRTDDGLTLAELPGVVFTAFGDVMRVPGTKGSPLEHKARGPRSAWSTRRSTPSSWRRPTPASTSSSSPSASRPRRPRRR
jgi:hydrogenase expression/formation protein HypD